MKKSMNRDFPLSPTPKGSEVSSSGPIKPMARVNADSLMSKVRDKKYVANINEQIGRAQIKNNGGNVPLEYTQNGMPRKGPTGNERMQKARELRMSASIDSAIAVKAKPSLTPKKK